MAKLLIFLSAFAAFAGASAVKDNVPEIKPSFPKFFLTRGATQMLNCSVNATEQNTKLSWYPPTMDGVTRRDETWLTSVRMTLRSSLGVDNFSESNAGNYTCSLLKNERPDSNATVQLILVKENKTEPLFVRDSKSATLSCSVDFDGAITHVIWLKSGVIVSDRTDSERFTVVDENSSLIINDPTREDAGLYIARFVFAGSYYSYDCEVEYQAGPLVLKFEKSKNLIEGDDLDLHCVVKGYPRAYVTWYKDKDRINATDRIILEHLNEYPNARLLIKNVRFSDAGVYTCEAYSPLFPNETKSQNTIVRVKDKLAALWPFLGIVGEVVVLCTIIFLYEQRRSKQVRLEENAAQETDGAAVDKKEGLRHRNTNNPSA